MKRRITNIYELRTEIVRAEADQRESERKMKDSLSKVGDELQPGKLLRSAAGSILKGSDGKNTALGSVLETVLSAAVSGLLFKNAGPLVKTVGSAVGSAVANQVFGEEGAKVVDRVKGIVSKIRAKTKSKSKGEGFDESNIYGSGESSES
ncbi:MAG: hypothetical protein ACU4F9_11630 [Arcticibacter sp.]|jgi:hypothetical protein